ncbi:MAG: alanine racemase [Lachnospiraceae bacterium]|nr:alanine racemase [Lachnospiraceae bacterium]
MEKFYRCSADINLDAIRNNIQSAQKLLNDGVKTCAIIKADGYGHGAVPIAKNLVDLVDFYAVASFEEAMELVNNGIKTPILILGYIHYSLNEEAIQNDIRLTVYDLDMAKKVSRSAVKVGKTAKIHLKINTGMNRIGFKPTPENLEVIKKISKLKNIEIEGVFTHFHSADEKSLSSSYDQEVLFKEYTDAIEAMGIHIPIKHCSNSAATIRMKNANYNMVRMGIIIYGLYPSKYVKQMKLQPAMTLKSHITALKTLQKGDTVGYGATFTAQHKMQLATVSVGYADGYMRNLKNKGKVLVRGQICKIVGSVCMDQIMIDVSKVSNVKVHDEVILVGKVKDKEISMEEVAELAGTINYEFACGITKRVSRRYLSKGKVVYIKEYC